MKIRRLKRDNLRSGLSLAEMAIVLMAMSVLFTMVFQVFFGVSRIAKNESPISIEKKQALLALENIRSSISQTYYLPRIKRLVFVGRSSGRGEYRKDSLTFASVQSGADRIGVPAVREVSFYLRENEGGDGTYTLIRREDQNVDDEPGRGGNHYPLLTNVLSLKILYSGDGVEWEEEWFHKKRSRLPRLIQVQLKVRIFEREYLYETLAFIGLHLIR